MYLKYLIGKSICIQLSAFDENIVKTTIDTIFNFHSVWNTMLIVSNTTVLVDCDKELKKIGVPFIGFYQQILHIMFISVACKW